MTVLKKILSSGATGGMHLQHDFRLCLNVKSQSFHSTANVAIDTTDQVQMKEKILY